MATEVSSAGWARVMNVHAFINATWNLENAGDLVMNATNYHVELLTKQQPNQQPKTAIKKPLT